MGTPSNAGAEREAGEWLVRAERDLQAARNELSAAPSLPEMTAYHAQQAAEKALKAFLTRHSVPFRHTHDLGEIHTHCEVIEPGFSAFVEAAQTLSPYGTQFRYPGGPLAPLTSEAEQALQPAADIVHFVRTLL